MPMARRSIFGYSGSTSSTPATNCVSTSSRTPGFRSRTTAPSAARPVPGRAEPRGTRADRLPGTCRTSDSEPVVSRRACRASAARPTPNRARKPLADHSIRLSTAMLCSAQRWSACPPPPHERRPSSRSRAASAYRTASASMLPLKADVSRVLLGELRSETAAGRSASDASALRSMLFERRCDELVLLLADEPSRQRLRDTIYAHGQLVDHPAFTQMSARTAEPAPRRSTITAPPTR